MKLVKNVMGIVVAFIFLTMVAMPLIFTASGEHTEVYSNAQLTRSEWTYNEFTTEDMPNTTVTIADKVLTVDGVTYSKTDSSIRYQQIILTDWINLYTNWDAGMTSPFYIEVKYYADPSAESPTFTSLNKGVTAFNLSITNKVATVSFTTSDSTEVSFSYSPQYMYKVVPGNGGTHYAVFVPSAGATVYTDSLDNIASSSRVSNFPSFLYNGVLTKNGSTTDIEDMVNSTKIHDGVYSFDVPYTVDAGNSLHNVLVPKEIVYTWQDELSDAEKLIRIIPIIMALGLVYACMNMVLTARREE